MNHISVISDESRAHLAALAPQIDAAVTAAKQHASAAVSSALHAGELLTQAKVLIDHGHWESWLLGNCTVSVRTAQAYMRLAEKLKAMPDETRNGVALLPLREAMKVIAAPTTPPTKRSSTHYIRCQDKREKAAIALKQSADALRGLTRNVRLNFIKRKEVERTRAKLQAALAVLDELQADDHVVDVEVKPAAEVSVEVAA